MQAMRHSCKINHTGRGRSKCREATHRSSNVSIDMDIRSGVLLMCVSGGEGRILFFTREHAVSQPYLPSLVLPTTYRPAMR